MKKFAGFPEGKVRFTPIPAPFFTELLSQVDHLEELKLMLYVFWRLDRMEGSFRYLRWADFCSDTRFMEGLGETPAAAEAALRQALQQSVERGGLLPAQVELGNGPENLYFLNTPKGRAAVSAIARDEWRPGGSPQVPVELSLEPPNIFRLYEEHFGPLTPMLAEALGEAEDLYPTQWIEEAFRIAVEANKRSWRYVEAILRRWLEEGRDERKDRKDTEKARRRYSDWEDD
jgi:DnaD/phage-associated family protein